MPNIKIAVKNYVFWFRIYIRRIKLKELYFTFISLSNVYNIIDYYFLVMLYIYHLCVL